MVFNHFMCPTDEQASASNLLEVIRPLQLVNNGSRARFSIIQTQLQIPPEPEQQRLPQVKCEPSSRIVFLPSSRTLQQEDKTVMQEDTTEDDSALDPELHIQTGEVDSKLNEASEDGYQAIEENDNHPSVNEDVDEDGSCNSTNNPTQELQVIIDRQSTSFNEFQTPFEKELLTPPKKRRCSDWNELGSPGTHSTSSVEGVLRVRSDLSISASPHPYHSDVEENSEDP